MSVQDGLRFYDDQKATMPRILDYGGWCCFGESHPSASRFPTHWTGASAKLKLFKV